MEFFKKTRMVKLKSHHGKYLYADDDECEVSQNRHGSRKNILWTVEFDESDPSRIKLKSCYDCYLTATNVPFLLGMTGKKVLQMKHIDSESSGSWIPVREGYSVKLKTRDGNFLRANGTIPPWRNKITHDTPHRSATQDWVLWEVEPVGKIMPASTPKPESASYVSHGNGNASFASNGNGNTSFASNGNGNASFASHGNESFNSNVHEDVNVSCTDKNNISSDDSSDDSSFEESPSAFVPKTPPSVVPTIDGRVIHFAVADDGSEIPEDFDNDLIFEGHDVNMLIERMKEVTEIEDDIYVCAKNHFTNKLYPLTLQLPPKNTPMYLVVVKASSKLARTLPNVQLETDHMYSRTSSLNDEYL